MKFDVIKLKDGPIEYTLDERPQELGLDNNEIKFPENINGNIKLCLFGKNILVTGKVNTKIILECGRCLEPFNKMINVEINLLYSSEPEAKKLPEEINPEEEILFYHDGQSIELTDEIRDSLLLEIPNFPICSDKCQGLCHICGINKNLKKCKCTTPKNHSELSDPLWKRQLQDLKKKK
ncbi:DUF177 domain-containing protein [Candidatus Dependentiae bacterium]|nr:DUF177 domain-containing protein [Candidatus Dependentiae bacterium]